MKKDDLLRKADSLSEINLKKSPPLLTFIFIGNCHEKKD
jgi:hypothetical protein